MTPEQEQLVLDNRKLAYWTLRDFRGHGMEMQDLEQLALEGLVRAAKSFRPELGYTFGTYATRVIRNLLITHHEKPVKRQRRLVPVEHVPEVPQLGDDDFDRVDDRVDASVHAAAILSNVGKRDYQMLCLAAEGLSQAAIGAILGVSQNMVSRDLKRLRRRGPQQCDVVPTVRSTSTGRKILNWITTGHGDGWSESFTTLASARLAAEERFGALNWETLDHVDGRIARRGFAEAAA